MPDCDAGSVTVMISFLRAGDRSQVPKLWELYFERLTRLARPIVPRGYDEDAALSAIDVFCNGIADGKFPYVDSREILWRTLATITERKARQRGRRGRKVSFEPLAPGSVCGDAPVDQLAVVEPTPEYKALVNLTLAELIECLENPLWRQAVLLLLEGYTVREIAEKIGRCREAVYLWFRTIRTIWEERLRGESFVD